MMFSIIMISLLPIAASACPLCDTATGQDVRAELFGDEFWPTLLTVLSPFPVLLALLAALKILLRRPVQKSQPGSPI